MLPNLTPTTRGGVPRVLAAALAALLTLLPSLAPAAEGESVLLRFGASDKNYLFASLAFGVLALIYAFVLVRQVLAASPGDARKVEVGAAIKSGALAYLRQQVGKMAIFGAFLFAGLAALNWSSGPTMALGIAAAFAFGAVGSYVAGYTGMVTAVNGNTRTAHAATTTYAGALKTAFRSGAVAGLVTVGIGLVGASVILLVGGEGAVRLLVGFAFGGSLAALFMRVGGGIFTKAADVGADLVGKVEAGIPEDDPRNPAVIADNVGDNVGDCAGMAADVFESYEVTLISAIILAAATSAVFDQTTWTKLVVFALMTAGIGIVASILGIASVKGSEDLNSDPLVPIRRGFNAAALIALVGTGALSYFLLGGAGERIVSRQLQPVSLAQREEVQTLQAIRDRLAKAKADEAKIDAAIKAKADALKRPVAQITTDDLFRERDKVPAELDGIPQAAVQRRIAKDTSPIQPYEITALDVVRTPEGKALNYDFQDEPQVDQLLRTDLGTLAEPAKLAGFSRVTNAEDPDFPQLKFATMAAMKPGADPTSPYTTVGAAYLAQGPDALVVKKVVVKVTIPARPAQGNLPATPETKINRVIWLGPQAKSELETLVKQQRDVVKQQGYQGSIEDQATYPVELYASRDGRLALGIPSEVDKPFALRPSVSMSYFPASVADLQAIQKKAQPGSPPVLPPQKTVDLAVVKATVAPWWGFLAAFLTGLLLALAIEKLTEYYVSTHRRPTREVAGVSSAGAAPMIIQGFAYALESSAMMVGLVVAALLAPLFIFPPAVYGGYALPLFGIALVGLGLLSTTGYVLAMDTFGPISDNAQGVYEMSGEKNERGATIVSRLDAAGNTTKALTKGFAIATAVVASIALFHSYLDSTMLSSIGLKLDVPEIFLGLLIGGAAPFLFSAFAINAVGRSSFQLINEVRRQFREDPGIMAGTSKPDYARCVAIVTAAAQKELIAPGILAIALPIAVGFGFSIGREPVRIGDGTYQIVGAEALGGFLAGAILSGQLLAVLLANSGGMWDNAKKLIEDGLYGGKGTENHKASVVCDTVGDPFKDTAGPALNPLIKVMNLVALLLAGVIIQPYGPGVTVTVTLVAVAALVFAILQTKKGSFSDDLRLATEDAARADAAPATPAPAPDAPKKNRLTIED